MVGGEDIKKDETKGDSRRSDLRLNKNFAEAQPLDLNGGRKKITEYSEASEQENKRRKRHVGDRFGRMTTIDQIQYIKEKSRPSESNQRSGESSTLLHKFNKEKFYESQ